MPRPAPIIDGRDMDAILREVRALVPAYVPEWDASAETGAGAALLKVYAKLLEGLVRRLNDVPVKNFIAFLDMLGVRLLPAQPARSPLTFFLSAGAKDAVPVQRRSQASAVPEDGGEPVIFETERAILATPAKLIAVYSVVPTRDRIFDHTQTLTGPKASGVAEVLSDTNPNQQEHSLYLAHDDLFNIKSPAQIDLSFTQPERGMRDTTSGLLGGEKLQLLAEEVKWQYYGEHVENGVKEQRWFDFGGVSVRGNLLSLVKDNTDELKQMKVNGINSRWIRGTIDIIKKPLVPTRPLTRIELLEVMLKVGPYDPNKHLGLRAVPAGIAPDALVYNDIPLDLPSPVSPPVSVFPFGPRPHQGDSFYIASQDAFSKKGAIVNIHFVTALLRPFGNTDADKKPELVWEYWNGKGWAPVRKRQLLDEHHQLIPFDGTDKFSMTGDVTFEAPEDIVKMQVAGLDSLWIRTRIVFGDYGQERVRQNFNSPSEVEINTDKIHPPQISDVSIRFNAAKPPQSVVTLNNLEYVAQPAPVPGKRPDPFTPFVALEDERQAIHLGFDRAPLKGPISVFFSLIEQVYTEETMPRVVWQYLKKAEADKTPQWGRLPVVDGTRSLTESGTAEFIGPEDFTQASRFGSSLYWVRAVDAEDKFSPLADALLRRLGVQAQPALQLSTLATSVNSLRQVTKNLAALSPEASRLVSLLRDKTHSVNVDNLVRDLTFAVREKAGVTTETGVDEGRAVAEAVPRDECGCRIKPCEDALGSLDPKFLTSEFSGLTYAPLVRGIYPNTAWVSQSETISNEIVGSSTGDAKQKYTLTKKPVTDEAVWVEEFGSLTETERKALAARTDVETEEKQNDAGVVVAFWVRWRRVEDLGAAGPSDRVYEIDQTFGLVEFGDGRGGRVPPIGRDNIRASYSAGGGSRGNVPAGAIKTMRTTIPSVEKVSNPEAAGGGSDTESVESALERGPQSIKNRGRAVTAEDFEWLTRASSRAVARVKCLPTFDDKGQYQTGWVTVIVVPGTKDARPTPSPQLSQRIERYLSDRAANVATFPRRVKVSGPVYVEVGITANVFPVSLDLAPAVEAESLKRLAAFLHPLTGGYAGSGWEFGRLPCLSDFYALLEAVEGVDHIESPTMTLQVVTPKGVPDGLPRAVTEDKPLSVEMPQYTLVYSGEHKVTLKGLV
jgi:uncharacterized phage protein gp47/JayE